MGKFNDLLTDIFSVFDSAAWVAESIATHPSNYISSSSTEYVRITIIPAGGGINPQSAAGHLIADIFTPAGEGPTRTFAIADILDTYLANQVLTTSGSGTTQFQDGALGSDKVDEDNPSLSRATYSISFNYFGAN